VFAVVASEGPLPAYRKWLRESFGGQSGWKPVPVVPAGVVWWDDGVSSVDLLTAGGVTHTVRGKDEELDGPAAAIKRLTDALRSRGRADAAAAIGFAVVPNK
jgi:hypothetical protein